MTVTSLLYAAGILAAILALIVAVGRLARVSRFSQQARGTANLSIVSTLSLDSRRRLLLVQCEGRRVLLLTGMQDQVIGWLGEPSA